MIFQNPTYLWGFLALTIPLAIHFLNRGEVKVIKVGSIKLLKEYETARTKNIRLNEYVLLALRLLALTLVVLLMAQPQITHNPSNTPLTFLIEPSLATHDMLKSLRDKIPDGAELKLLSDGFPEIEEGTDINMGKPNYWQLMQDMEKIPTDSIVIFAKGLIESVKGMRPKTTINSNWIFVDDLASVDKPIAAFVDKDKYQLITQVSDERVTSFKVLPPAAMGDNLKTIGGDSLRLVSQEKSSVVPIVQRDTIKVAIMFEKAFEKESHYFKAACTAILRYSEWPSSIYRLEAQANLDLSDTNVLIWLAHNEGPKFEGVQISYDLDEVANKLLKPTAVKGKYHLTERLGLNAIEDGRLVSELEDILNLDLKVEEIANFDDIRLLPKAELIPVYIADARNQFKKEVKDVPDWLWFLLVPVLVTERLLAKHRKQ